MIDPTPCPRCIPDERWPLTMGRPNRWLDALRFRCVAGHVTGGRLDDAAVIRCLTCDGPAALTFPEDTSRPTQGASDEQ